jgi:hypothetical protein
MAVLAPLLAIAGTAISVAGTLAAGDSAAAAGEYQQKQYEIKAQNERVIGQQQAFAIEKKKDLALSSLQARAASGGGDVSDPTVLNLAGGIESEGTLQALTALAAGENRARGYQDQGALERFEGESYKQASRYKAVSTLAESGSSFFQKYGGQAASSFGYG